MLIWKGDNEISSLRYIMERKDRIIQFGCGGMGSICMKFAQDHGAEIVGAYDLNPNIIGKNIGTRIDSMDDDEGILISNAADFEKELKSLAPDIVVITTLSLVKDVYPTLKICAENGINAITTCEEAIYSWNSSPALTKAIDDIAKKTGATISGSGAQELQWGSTINNLAAGINRITKITGTQQNNIDDYGIAFAESFGVGMELDEFNKKFEIQNQLSDLEIHLSLFAG